MFKIIKPEIINIFGSLILGMGLIAVFKEQCKTEECEIHKAPHVNDVIKSTYQIGTKCYQFKTNQITCPKSGVIEAFQVSV
jgi:hypothetical protein